MLTLLIKTPCYKGMDRQLSYVSINKVSNLSSGSGMLLAFLASSKRDLR